VIGERGAGLDEQVSWRERRVLALIAEGHTNDEIAEVLRVASSTVAEDMRKLRGKLGARNRAHAVGNWFRLVRDGKVTNAYRPSKASLRR
jgi:ATP/maltotriose-dependent transcriptional regulator MalT